MSFDVFHLDGERGLRGGERQLLYLACALRARGHRSVVVCRSSAPLGAQAKRLGLEVLPAAFAMEWDPVSALALARACRRARRPILHAHTAHAASISALAGQLAGIPQVVHRRVDFALAGGLSRRFKYDPAQRVVAVSEAIRGVLIGSGIDSRKIEVVPDGLPTDAEECGWVGMEERHFAPATATEKERLRRELAEEFNIPPQATWIGNLAALVPHKDHDTLIAAALIVLLKHPDAVFLIAGEGPEQPRLLSQIKRMGLLGRVLLLGQRPDAAALLKALDLFVLSSWGEGMGSVLLEAAACGLPLAATNAGGISELVADKSTGLLCAVRDPEALAANILRLLDEPSLARGLSEEGRRRLPRFGLRRMAESMEKVYERIAAHAAS